MTQKAEKIKKQIRQGKYKMPDSKVLADCLFFFAFQKKRLKFS